MEQGIGRLRDDRGIRRAANLSLGLWTIGFLIYATVMAVADGQVDPPAVLVAYLIQYAAALLLAGVLVGALHAWRGWPGIGRVVATVALVPVLSVLLGAVDNGTLSFVAAHGHPEMAQWAYLSLSWLLRTSFLYFWVFCVDTALILLAFTIERVAASEREVAELRATAAQAQLAMLRYQLNPHFLFNTLNAISSLVVTGRVKAAEEMIARLSAFLRETLTSDPQGTVPVEDELALVQDYLAIESVRFGERLRVAIDCDPAAGALPVPSFILQPLVENAIKHGVGPSVAPVTVSIGAAVEGAALVLRVCDDGPGKESGAKGTGVGQRNTRARLAALYGARATVRTGREACGYVVELRLPAAPRRALAA